MFHNLKKWYKNCITHKNQMTWFSSLFMIIFSYCMCLMDSTRYDTYLLYYSMKKLQQLHQIMCYHHFYELFLILTIHLKSLPWDSCTVSQWNRMYETLRTLPCTYKQTSFQKPDMFGVNNTKSVLSLILSTVSRGYRILE